MTDLDPCLLGCDKALAEADLLIDILSGESDSLDPELAAVRHRIATLRHEVERLRGVAPARSRRKDHPDWSDLTGHGSPWAALGGA